MNNSLIISNSPSPYHSSFLFTPLKNPNSYLRLKSSRSTNRRRFRLSLRISANNSDRSLTSTSPTPSSISSSEVFGGKRELSGVDSLVDRLSPPIRLANSVLIVATALASGYGIGLRFGGTKNTSLVGAVAFGLAGGAAAYTLNSRVPQVAAVNLHNYVAASDNPVAINKEDIEAIAAKYGVSKQDEAFNAELCDIYCRFVSSVIPTENEDLKGNEVETIIKFKRALGIDDPDAANMHMEIGRRIFRQRLETGDREGDAQQRRAFQKLIYVSTLVFGEEASTFLLPWKRVFKVTDSQVEVAIRDNAQRLYSMKLKSVGRDVDVKHLVQLREAQILYRLSDELADDMFKEHIRKLIEVNISAALTMLKSRTSIGKNAPVIEELDKTLEFNNVLNSLRNHPDAASFARGIGSVSLAGGDFDNDRKMDELKLLYRVYVADALSSGRMEENKVASLSQLRNIFGLGKKEAEAIMVDVTLKAYRKRLSQSVTSGALEAADSKAAYLQNLCEELHFDPLKASQVHEEIYRQKLQQCLTGGELSDEDVAALLRLRVLLCIPHQSVEAAHTEICGSLFEKVVKEAIAAGVDGYDADVQKSVRKAAHGLRLTREAAMSIASKAVRKIFVNYVKRSRSTGNRTEAAKELKKMIAFNTLVVTQLVADIKGESLGSNEEEKHAIIDIETNENDDDDDDEWESLQTLRKIKPAADNLAGKPSQTEITLKDDFPERDRTDLYKTYLMFCLSGEVTRIPFGAQITTKKDDSEFILLNQLGAILGLSPKEIVEVHRGLAEEAFRQQAEVILADGQLTKARMEQLNEVQKQVGLPPQYAQKVIKNITTTKMAAAIETAVNQGRLSIKQIRELKEASVDVDSMISDTLRQNLFKKTVDEIFSSGTGEFDEEEVYEKIPADLKISADKARKVVHGLAQARLSNSLIQAVSLLRQRNPKGVVASLNDMLACDKAVKSESLTWELPEELSDLFGIYLKSNQTTTTTSDDDDKVSRLQYLLGISDSTAAALREMGDRMEGGVEKEEFVF